VVAVLALVLSAQCSLLRAESQRSLDRSALAGWLPLLLRYSP
jgi:hypothetical protein